MSKNTLMRKILTLLLLFYFTLNFPQAFLVGLVTNKNINKKKLVYTNEEGKYLIYLPTVHVGKKEYYESIKKEVDSLRNEGFIIAYEGIRFEINKPDFELKAKKMRRILGFNIANINDENRDALPKEYSNKKYLLQSEINTGILKTDVNFDVSLNELIEKYESKYGVVSLSDCDLQTSLSTKYDCKQKKIPSFYITDVVRVDHVKDELKNYKDKNIVLLYGKGHRYFLNAGFLDHGYKLVRGKL